ncbi:hypothetical protein GQ457_11G029490 [Hibiscus cannabinus]
MQEVEKQVSLLAQTLSRIDSQIQGKLPSQTEPNPRGNVSAITLRSGTVIEPSVQTQKEKKSNAGSQGDDAKEGSPTPEPEASPYVAQPPFPVRFIEEDKQAEVKEKLDVFRKDEVHIPLLKVIQEMPMYAHFLKELCANTIKFSGQVKVNLGEHISMALTRWFPPKIKDQDMVAITRNQLCGSGIGARVDAEQYGKDVVVLKNLVKELYGHPETQPKVLGDDPNLMGKILDPFYLNQVSQTYKGVLDVVKKFKPQSGAWVSELGGAFNSGSKDVSQTFADGFCTVLAVSKESDPNLRVYAHCAKRKPGVSLVFINLSKDRSFNVTLSNLKSEDVGETNHEFGGKQNREEYHLTALGGDIKRNIVRLNNVQMVQTESRDIPAMDPELVDASTPISIASQSITYDLTYPLLINAIKVFNPLRIKVAGSLQDNVVYKVGEVKSCPNFMKKEGGLFGLSQGCLSMERWDLLNRFFNLTGEAYVRDECTFRKKRVTN